MSDDTVINDMPMRTTALKMDSHGKTRFGRWHGE